MSQKRKRTRDAGLIVINSSSSDTSEASEDSTPESDVDSPKKRGGFAAENDMSERQTRKINSGSFGMFNKLTLSSSQSSPSKRSNSLHSARRPRTAKTTGDMASGESTEGARDRRRTGRKRPSNRKVVVVDDESEDEQSLFISETTSQQQPGFIDCDAESSTEIFNDMTPERKERVKEYMRTLAVVERADASISTAENEVRNATAEHVVLSQKLTEIEAVADKKVAEAIQARDEAIKIANEVAEARMKRIREDVPRRKEKYERKLHACDKRKEEAKERVCTVRLELEGARERKVELERLGGFELGSDVEKVQVCTAGKGW